MVSLYLVLVKLVHSLCDPIAVIHPQHPGKPGDKASIAWGRKRSGSRSRSPLPCPGHTHRLPGVLWVCLGSFPFLNIGDCLLGRMEMGRQELPALGEAGLQEAGLRAGRAHSITPHLLSPFILPRPLKP